MSALETPTLAPARPELVADEVPRRRPGWVELATSGDHKSVGLMYIGAALSFCVLALVELLLMRLQLAAPENTLLKSVTFYRLLSMYGATTVFLFALPLAAGLISYVVPLQIGARSVALPRLGSLSVWLYLAGAVTLYSSFLWTPPEAGFNPLPPLSDNTFLSSNGTDVWITGVGLVTLGLVCFAVNLVATLRTMRAPGMVWRRVPIFSWAAAIYGWTMLVIGPVMLAAVTMLMIDRNFSGVFFDAGEGGAPILWQHLSWFFYTGAYLLTLIVAFGAISEILPVFSRKPSFGHRTLAGSMIALCALGLLAWMQNMYTAAISIGFLYFAMVCACLAAIPVGVLLVNWMATLAGGTLRMRAPLRFALGAISTIAIGLAGELLLSVIPIAWQLGDTTAATAATSYAMVGAAVFGGFAALYYWFPKMTGRIPGEGLARIAFWLTLIGVHATFAPMFLAGLRGQPVDLYEYFSGLGITTYNLVSTIGAFVLAIGIVLAIANLVNAARSGPVAGHDPWGGNTLEWYALSPPPEHNFDVVPDVRSAEPLRDIRDSIRRPSRSAARPSAPARPPDAAEGTPVA
jgi:heme/copper-type cytochrome/quinol oxidase subunit 1